MYRQINGNSVSVIVQFSVLFSLYYRWLVVCLDFVSENQNVCQKPIKWKTQKVAIGAAFLNVQDVCLSWLN
jgi:hypothetical protein